MALVGDHRARPRRVDHGRHLCPGRVRGDTRHGHRPADDLGLLALRHRGRVRQGPREHPRASSAATAGRTRRQRTSRSTRRWSARSTPRSWRCCRCSGCSSAACSWSAPARSTTLRSCCSSAWRSARTPRSSSPRRCSSSSRSASRRSRRSGRGCWLGRRSPAPQRPRRRRARAARLVGGRDRDDLADPQRGPGRPAPAAEEGVPRAAVRPAEEAQVTRGPRLAERVAALVRDVPTTRARASCSRTSRRSWPTVACSRRWSTSWSAHARAIGPIDAVAGIEARGFILGAPVARALGVGFVPIRKQGKLPVAHDHRELRPRVRRGGGRDPRGRLHAGRAGAGHRRRARHRRHRGGVARPRRARRSDAGRVRRAGRAGLPRRAALGSPATTCTPSSSPDPRPGQRLVGFEARALRAARTSTDEVRCEVRAVRVEQLRDCGRLSRLGALRAACTSTDCGAGVWIGWFRGSGASRHSHLNRRWCSVCTGWFRGSYASHRSHLNRRWCWRVDRFVSRLGRFAALAPQPTTTGTRWLRCERSEPLNQPTAVLDRVHASWRADAGGERRAEATPVQAGRLGFC